MLAKTYQAVVHGRPPHDEGTVDLSITLADDFKERFRWSTDG